MSIVFSLFDKKFNDNNLVLTILFSCANFELSIPGLLGDIWRKCPGSIKTDSLFKDLTLSDTFILQQSSTCTIYSEHF